MTVLYDVALCLWVPWNEFPFEIQFSDQLPQQFVKPRTLRTRFEQKAIPASSRNEPAGTARRLQYQHWQIPLLQVVGTG